MIAAYGGEEGLRDAGLLHSSIAMPMACDEGEFLHTDLFEMAAPYLYHIAQNHAFLDGNKRSGAACAIIFLTMNQVELESDEEGLVDVTLQVATGQIGKSEVADFFRRIAHSPK